MGTKDALLAGTAATPPADEIDNEKKALFGDMTDEQLAEMTDEERAGIDDGGDEDGDDADGDDADDNDGEGDDEGSDNADGEGKKEADEGEDDEDDADGADGADGDAVAETGAEDGTAGEDEANADDEEDPLDITRSIMPNEWQSLPKDSDDKLKALDTQVAELADKFDAGDLTAREYHQQQQALADERFALKTQINDANKAFNKAMTDWTNRTVKGFLREHKEYTSNETLNRMLDGEVRALQANGGDPFNPRILRKAHANIQAALGKAPEPKTDGKKAAKKDKTPLVPGKKPQVPPTLARVPQDEIEDAEGGRFARLERMEKRSPHDFEEAFSRLSPADQDAYLAGG